MKSKVRINFEELVKYKARRMKLKKNYKPFREDLLLSLNITQLDEAFLLGAFDGMTYEMAGSIGQAFMKPKFRKAQLSEIYRELFNVNE
jgi:hypothetical protein